MYASGKAEKLTPFPLFITYVAFRPLRLTLIHVLLVVQEVGGRVAARRAAYGDQHVDAPVPILDVAPQVVRHFRGKVF